VLCNIKGGFSLKPEVDDFTIRIPTAFDQSSGRIDRKTGKIITVIVLTLLVIVTIIGTFNSDDKSMLAKIFTLLGVVLAVTFWLRFITFTELTYSDAFESLKEKDYTPSLRSYWRIFKVDDMFPYICHYKDGSKGVFVAFVKDVVVGKPNTVMFDHYDAIGRAYQAVGSSPISIRHIDYMNSLGDDSRLDGLFATLNNCDNPDVKELLFQIYDNLGFQMSQDYASFDVYLLKGNLSDVNLWYNIKKILDVMISSNYLSYKVLDAKSIESLTKIVFNLKSFNIQEACESVFASDNYSGLVPIRIIKADGTIVKLNDTIAEKAEKARLLKEAEAKRKAEWNSLSFSQKLSRRLSTLTKVCHIIYTSLSGVFQRISFFNKGTIDSEAINNVDLANARIKTNLNASNELRIIAENEAIEQSLREEAKRRKKAQREGAMHEEPLDILDEDTKKGEDDFLDIL
jgi:hypothetical protein